MKDHDYRIEETCAWLPADHPAHGIWRAVREEMASGHEKFGDFNSAHELYAVLKEEVDEFWDTVKADDPDPRELLQVAAIALRGCLQYAKKYQDELEAAAERLMKDGCLDDNRDGP